MGTVILQSVPVSERNLVNYHPNCYYEEDTVTAYWKPIYIKEGIQYVIDFLKNKNKDESWINGYQTVNGTPVFLLSTDTHSFSDDLLGGENEQEFTEKHTITSIYDL